MSMFELIAQVQHTDLAQEEERVKTLREQRRLLRLQANQGASINDLLTQLAGITEEKSDLAFSSSPEVLHAPRTGGGFPAPPTSAGAVGVPR